MKSAEVLQLMGRRDFLKKVAAVTVATTLLSSEKALGADTSLLPWDHQDLDGMRREAAGRYGWDVISSDARFWRPAGDGGMIFESPDGLHHGLIIQGKDGRGAEFTGWQKVKNIYGDVALIVAHRNVQILDVMAGTIYPHKDADAGWDKLKTEVKANRQPGQIFMPLNSAPGITNQGEIPLFPIGSKEDAARRFGVPGTWGADSNNWEVFDGGDFGDRFAKLRANPDGTATGIKLNGAVAQGFFAIERNGVKAAPFVAHPDVKEIFGAEINLRLSSNLNALWRNTLTGTRISEGRSGSGTFPLPVIW